MKKADIVTAIFARKPLIVVAYIGHTAEVKRNETPKKNQAAESYLSKHSVLWGSKTYELTQFKNSHAELNAVKALAPEFTVMAVEVDGIEETKWGNRMKGKLFAIEA